MKDRLSVHIDNGQSDVREAVTILRNGGTGSQSGLVGITNAIYDPDTGSPVIPATIFNIQSTGDSNIRFSSGPSKDYRSSLELLGVGNTRASGLHFSYDPQFDDSYIDADSGYGNYEPCVNPGGTDKTVADFSLIRPSGEEGMEFSHISLSERGYVSIGLTRVHEQRHFEANAPLTIAYACDGHQDSGTISIHEQASAPATHADFGKVYVKPYSVGGRTQALYFKDDGGTETNLVLSQDLEPSDPEDGLVYGDSDCNTYGGLNSPPSRATISSREGNTIYGNHVAIDSVFSSGNLLMGCETASGLSQLFNNIVLGNQSAREDGELKNNIILGHRSAQGLTNGLINSILIGHDLQVDDDDASADGLFLVDSLIRGSLTENSQYMSVTDGYFSVLDTDDVEFKIINQYDDALSRFTTNIDLIDYNRGGSQYPQNNLKFNFKNSDGVSNWTLFQLESRNAPMTNTPSFGVVNNPYARLDGDLLLRGSIRFADGSTLSGLSGAEYVPVEGASGVQVVFEDDVDKISLNYSSLELASSLGTIAADTAFVALQVGGASSNLTGKISLEGLAEYVGSGNGDTIAVENCNIVAVDSESRSDVSTSNNKNSVMIGCSVATNATGWVNSVIIGAEAGADATTPNAGLSTESAAIFIGSRAGKDCDNVYRTLCIGNNAGQNADGASDSIFIGSNAGLNTSYDNSIGLGEWALAKTTADVAVIGSGNLEIVTGLLNNQRLMYNQSLNSRMNIQNTIAGRVDRRNISIGDARLSPTAPLEVRKDNTIHADNGNDHIQTWYCDDVLVASLDCSGNLRAGQKQLLQNVEGLVNDSALVVLPPSISVPQSGKLAIYEAGVATGEEVYITNRDTNLAIPNGTYVVATRIGSEYRPTWVG
jgi:hypothetical protein